MRINNMQKRKANNELRDWRDIQFFLAVARTGSYSSAARSLRTNQSTVGRRIQRLEESLGTKLFDRYSHGMRLTPAGELMFSEAADMESSAAHIERHITGFDEELTGIVKISSTEGLATYWLAPRMAAFQREHPAILIETVCKDRVVDLGMREADIAIRYVQPDEPRLVAKKVGILKLFLFAAPRYIQYFGEPQTYEDLFRHRLVDHTALHLNPAWTPWTELVNKHPAVAFRSNSTSAVVAAIRIGMGIGLLPVYTEEVVPEFVRLRVDLECEAEIWLVSHEETNRCARIRLVIDHLSRLFEHDRSEWFSGKPRAA
ncbi:MAG: LysR family transcriptional regulator [Proteobacteria bacterium]|nr:LysR family transcriptional regulator [Pseudomonadota bacterium]